MKRLYAYIRPCGGMLAAAIFFKGCGAFTDLLIPYLMGVVINQGIAGRNAEQIVRD